MNKSKLNKIVFILVITNVIFFTIFSIITYRRVQPVPQTKTIIVTDTLTQVMYDTIFVDHFETVKLPVVDTIVVDSLRIDSIFVDIPISKFQLDTCFTTDTTNLNIMIQNSGFNVTLDSLSYRLEYTPTPIKLPKKNFFKEHFKFGVGVSTGFGVFSKKPDVFLGGGFYYCF